MAVRNIVTDEDDILQKKCRLVEKFDDKLWTLLDDMLETLHISRGVGLAAPQVGILRRIAIVEINPEDGPIELINPEIIKKSGEQIGMEGCLSSPGQWGIVSRPYSVTVRAQNRKGEIFEVSGTGLMARAFCHEIDHLDGVLYKTMANRMLTPVEVEMYNNGELEIEEKIYEEE